MVRAVKVVAALIWAVKSLMAKLILMSGPKFNPLYQRFGSGSGSGGSGTFLEQLEAEAEALLKD